MADTVRSLVTARPLNLFGEWPMKQRYDAIFCRNVMIYFDKELQERAHKLFYESLCKFGILGLGAKESLRFSPYEEKYEALDSRNKLYRRVQ